MKPRIGRLAVSRGKDVIVYFRASPALTRAVLNFWTMPKDYPRPTADGDRAERSAIRR